MKNRRTGRKVGFAWAGALVGTLTLAALVNLNAPARPAGAPVIITLDLGRYSQVGHLDAGPYAGVSSGRVVVRVGDSVVFVNSDSRRHTATSLGDATVFPKDPHWTDSALRASGTISGAGWSTGDLAPGTRSAPIAVTQAGTYLYGDFYDYSAGVRGEIVVKP